MNGQGFSVVFFGLTTRINLICSPNNDCRSAFSLELGALNSIVVRIRNQASTVKVIDGESTDQCYLLKKTRPLKIV